MGNISNKSTKIDDNKLLVNGYVRSNANICKIVIIQCIIDIIEMYYINNNYKIFGIGHNPNDMFGTGHANNLNTFTLLIEMSSIVNDISDLNNIYWTTSKIYILKSGTHEIYFSGYDANNVNVNKSVKFNKLNLDKQCVPKWLTNKSVNTLIYTNKNNIYPLTKNKHFHLNISGLIKMNINIIDIQSGLQHTLLLSDTGDVFITGFNKNGIISSLCIDKNLSNDEWITQPMKISLFDTRCKKILKISVGLNHNLMINENNDLIVFGDNTFGQTAINDIINENMIISPMTVQYFKQNNIKIKHIDTTYNHSLVIDSNNYCYTFGNNKYGNCGCYTTTNTRPCWGNSDGIYTPYKLPKYKFIDGKCGNYHTLLLTNDHQIISFGLNQHHQCSSIINDHTIETLNIINKKKELKLSKNSVIEKIMAMYNKSIIIANTDKTI